MTSWLKCCQGFAVIARDSNSMAVKSLKKPEKSRTLCFYAEKSRICSNGISMQESKLSK